MFAGIPVRDFYADGLIGSVREKSTFAGVDGIEQTFACKLAALEDGEATAVKGELWICFAARRRGAGAVRCGSTG